MATFHNKLVLSKFMLHQFGVLDFKKLNEFLKDSSLEGYTEAGNTKYLDQLINRFFDNEKITASMLQEYDENIVRFTHEISNERTETIKWKYFQYLSLLFVEVYLEKYFGNKTKLVAELNAFVEKFNNPLDEHFLILNPTKIVVEKFTEKELNKIAFWNATGSGKTLLMHINIKQFMHYTKKYNQGTPNKIILITPNEGLSKQHLEEFVFSDIEANPFTKSNNYSYFSGYEVEVIEITKLSEESGEKTIAVDSFETDNLVLIDEGHRGASGDKWKNWRDKLSETGFAFEYSATFGQAINASTGKTKKDLEQEYIKSILFDYSYKYFFEDGYGKNYKILNISNEQEDYVRKYFTANLLSFYQQILLYNNKETLAKMFMIEQPLWVFVGSKVTKTLSKEDISDVLQIVVFIKNFIKDPTTAILDIDQILKDEAGLIDSKGTSVFYDAFFYLAECQLSAEDIYKDIINKVFNSEVLGANLYLDNLKGATGELGLRIGEADYFGVINVGDDAKLHTLAKAKKIDGVEKDFSTSLFQKINQPNSNINLLIGSKKFSEGWSSWRVSSMGLMNIGKSEGSQIIQLFGRGVRLKGYNYSLKRSSGLDDFQKPKNLKEYSKYLSVLETLNIFGVKADYMQKFKEFLEQEGLPKNDIVWHKVIIQTQIKTDLLANKLKIIQVDDKQDFKQNINVKLTFNEGLFSYKKIELDWYPKIQMLKNDKTNIVIKKEQCYIEKENLAFVDWKKIFFEIENYKFDKGWTNLSITLQDLKNIIQSKSWYNLFIPKAEMLSNKFSQILVWENIVIALLKKYTEKYYNNKKNKYNSEHIETKILEASDDNFINQYEVRFNVEGSTKTIQENIKQLVSELEQNIFEGSKKIGTDFIAFDTTTHLYKPLLYLNKSAYRADMKISPVPLDFSEKDFIDDLILHHKKNTAFYDDKKVFLIRNQSRKGIGFFLDTNNFYPDFILWILIDNKQYITFLDPKGIMLLKAMSDEKIQFHKLIKEQIQPKVDSENIILNSFILSNTSFGEVGWRENKSIEDFHQNNVYFQKDDKHNYIDLILKDILK